MPIRILFGNWTNFIKTLNLKPLKVIPVGARKGSKNKKGVSRQKSIYGYIQLFKPKHPTAQKNGYVMEHRMVAYDSKLLTDLSMEVHHRNGDKTDNRIENLEVMTKAKHTSLTWRGVKGKNGRFRNIYESPELLK